MRIWPSSSFSLYQALYGVRLLSLIIGDLFLRYTFVLSSSGYRYFVNLESEIITLTPFKTIRF